MAPADRSKHIAWFRTLDRVFWLAWAGFPVMIWLAYVSASDPASSVVGMTPEQAKCLEILPQPTHMSPLGKVIYWALFSFQLSIYVVLLTILHRIIHRFSRGRIFVSESLASLQWIGVVLIIWPFLMTVVSNLAAFGLKARGDIQVFLPSYVVDIGPVAVGMFLIALRYVLEHGIALKSENDLTI